MFTAERVGRVTTPVGAFDEPSSHHHSLPATIIPGQPDIAQAFGLESEFESEYSKVCARTV